MVYISLSTVKFGLTGGMTSCRCVTLAYLLQVERRWMMSRDSDVIGRCANAADSPTKRFYFMTSLDDDVDELQQQEQQQQQQRVDDECLLNNERRCDDDDDDDGGRHGQAQGQREVHHGEKHRERDEQEQRNGERDRGWRERERGQELPQSEEDEHQDFDDDDDDDDDDDGDDFGVNEETLCQSDIADPTEYNLCEIFQPCPGTDRPPSTSDLMMNVLETVDQLYNVPAVSPPISDVLITQTKPNVTPRTTDNIEDIRIDRQRHSLPLTTSHQPISDETETGNRISFDRKLIDEIDAAMAQNGYKTLRRAASGTHGSAHSDHVTQTVNKSGESHPCDLDDCQSRSRGKTGKRRHHGLSVINKHEQTAAAATVTGL